MVEFTSGAKRDELKPRYDLIPACALRRLAQRYQLGADRYGDNNWQKGLPLQDVFNHIIEHLLDYQQNPHADDDNLAAAMWGLCALMWYEERDLEGGKVLEPEVGRFACAPEATNVSPLPPVAERLSTADTVVGAGLINESLARQVWAEAESFRMSNTVPGRTAIDRISEVWKIDRMTAATWLSQAKRLLGVK